MKALKRTITLAVVVAFLGLLVWAFLTQPLLHSPTPNVMSAVNPKSLEHHVRMLSETLPSRSDDVDKLNESADYIFAEFETFGKPTYHEFSVWGIPYRNVVLRIGPEDKNPIVVGAHYDSADGLPGADDNASGVASLIELGRKLSEIGLDTSIELVAFALEEPPYFGTEDMGSFHHAAWLASEGRKPKLMICLEMVGYFVDAPNSQRYPLSVLRYIYPDTGNFIAIVGRPQEMFDVRKLKRAFSAGTDLPIRSINAPPIVPGLTLSDHRNYWSHGFKAVMITDTAFFRNPNYHTANDTADTLDYVRMAKVVEGTLSAVVSLANGH